MIHPQVREITGFVDPRDIQFSTTAKKAFTSGGLRDLRSRGPRNTDWQRAVVNHTPIYCKSRAKNVPTFWKPS